MTLKEIYQEKRKIRVVHPATQFLMEISGKTGYSMQTLKQWISGIQSPSLRAKLTVSEALGMEVEELFPVEDVDANA